MVICNQNMIRSKEPSIWPDSFGKLWSWPRVPKFNVQKVSNYSSSCATNIYYREKKILITDRVTSVNCAVCVPNELSHNLLTSKSCW